MKHSDMEVAPCSSKTSDPWLDEVKPSSSENKKMQFATKLHYKEEKDKHFSLLESNLAHNKKPDTLKVEPHINKTMEHSDMEVAPCSSKTITDPWTDEEAKPSSSENKAMQFEIEMHCKENDKHFSLLESNLADKNPKEIVYDLSLKNLPEEYKDTYDAYIKEVEAKASIPILQSITEEDIKNFKHFNVRYYEEKYCIDFGVAEQNYCDINVRIHTNKLMLISLASGNAIIRNQRPIININFVINKSDRSNIHVKGKKKRGSKGIEAGTILCQVKCEGDDKLYNVRAGVRGNIIEINEHIKTNPDLVRTDPKGMGFIAIIMPPFRPNVNQNKKQQELLTEEEYINHLMHRPPTCPSASSKGT